MKKLRYTILTLIFCIFSIITIVVFSNFKTILNFTLKDILKMNIQVENVYFNMLDVEIENIKLNTVYNEKVGHINKAKLRLNPLAITRLNNVELIGGQLFVTQNKKGRLNLEDLIKQNENSSDDIENNVVPHINVTSIGKIKIKNVDVVYKNYEFKDIIEVNAYNANGTLDISRTKELLVDVEAKLKSKKGNLDGRINFAFDIKNEKITINLDNAYVKKELLQFAPIDFLKLDDAKLNGNIIVYTKKDVEVDIDLNGIGYNVEYLDLDKNLNEVDFRFNMHKSKLDLIAKTKIGSSTAKLNLDANVDDYINVSVDVEDMPYSILNKYKLVNEQNLNLEGNLTGSAIFKFNLKDNNVELKEYDINAKSKKIKYNLEKYGDIIFNDIDILLNSNKYEKNSSVDIKSNITYKDSNYLKLDTYLEANGNLNLFSFNGELNLNLDTKTDIEKLKKINANFNFNSLDDISLTVKNDYLSSNTKYKKDDKEYKFNMEILNGLDKLEIFGNTKIKDFKHNYKINLLTKEYKLDSNLDGNGYNINLEYSAKIKKFIKDNIYLYNTNIKGVAKNIFDKSISINSKLKVDELWFNYQRLKDISMNLNYLENKVILKNIENENLKANVIYNIKNNSVDLSVNLQNYMLYTTNSTLDINLLVNNLNLKANGLLNKLNVIAKLDDSNLVLNGQNIGVINANVDTKNNIIDLKSKINANNIIDISYNQNNQKINANVDINQKLSNILKDRDIDANIISELKLQGTIDKLNGDLLFNIKDIKYNDKNIPSLNLEANFKDIDLLSNLRKGIVDIKNINILSSDDEQDLIYNTSLIVDLSNININHRVKNMKLDLSKISNDLRGIVNLSSLIKYNSKIFYAEFSLDSKKFSIANNEFDNLVFSIQANDKGFNIGQGYLEYQKNPLLIDGYALFDPVTYNIRVLAQDFNMGFLKFNKNIEEADGTLNVDLLIDDGHFKGNIKLNDFSIKTDNLYIKNTNIDIGLLNKNITINKMGGIVNNGRADIIGELVLPSINKKSFEKKKINLGDMNIRITTKDINLKYGANNAIVSSLIELDNKKLNAYIDVSGGNITKIDMFNSKKSDKKESYFISEIKEMVYNTLEDYNAKLDLNIVSPININIPNYLIIQKINGELIGNARVNITKLRPYIYGKFDINNGSYRFNTNLFNVDKLSVKLDGLDKINPYIELLSSTVKNDEKINISIDSNLDDLKIKISSDKNKSKEELLNLLTLNAKKSSIGKDVLNFATTTAINQALNSITNPIGRALGLTKFELNTNRVDISNFVFKDIFKSINANLYLQGRIYKDIYWNFKTKIPFDILQSPSSYDIGLSYELRGNLNALLGINIKSYPNNAKDIGFYIGLSYQKNMLYLFDMFNLDK